MFDGVRLRRAEAPQSAFACVFVCETAVFARVSEGKQPLIINLAQLESQLWTRKVKKGKKSPHEYSVGELCEDALEMQQLVRERVR